MKKAHIETDRGEIVCELFEDDAPGTVANFVGLATGTLEWTDPKTREKRIGVPFYDGLRFHRVVENFVIQGGDPWTRYDDQQAMWGRGGPGHQIKCETSGSRQKHVRGVLSMAHAGKDTGGSQFFITHTSTPHLDRRHTVFGATLSGVEVVDAIRPGDRIKRIWIEQ
jgi:peptidyl-prolyl cis-trans isomerase A (cyclophilin A)